jgi:hypothetical protein
MKVKTITHIKTYQTSQFHFDKIGLEETFPSDKSDAECILELSRRIDAMAKEVYPWVFANGGTIKVTIPYGMAENDIEIPVTPPRQDPEPEENISLLDRINNSTNAKELKSWELLIKVEKDAKKKAELQSAYDKKMDELKNRPAHETK